MFSEARVQEVLEELLESDRTPEEACAGDPELLRAVRPRWEKVRRVGYQLDALFPPDAPPGGGDDVRRPAPIESPRIDGYEVEGILGRGGMGVIFQARHLKLNRLVALKSLLAGAHAGPEQLARFRREAEAVAALRHPNIVQIYDVGELPSGPYFTMELVEGGSLARKLDGRPLPPRQAAELIAALACGVQFAHQSGIVHRDLKPANVLLTAEGAPKISDFGLARRLEREDGLTRSGTAVGTPSYMAPEQVCDRAGPIGPATDVYGLGAVLYELLTGRPPFRAGSDLETFRQVLAEEPVPPSRLNPRVPRDLETVCLKCLRKEPHRRYASAAALAGDLRRYLLGQVVVARPVGPLERVGKWLRRNPAVAGLSAAAVLALLAGTAASLRFAVEAGRQAELAADRAGDLERQAIALREQTRAAEGNARLAEEKEQEVTRVLVSGLLIPIGSNPHQLTEPLDAAEVEAVRHLRATPAPIRLQFLETALRDKETARRLGRRADQVIQALVGGDRALRAEVERLLVRRIRESGAPQEVLLACARLGLAVNCGDRVWAERSAAAVMVALRDPLVERTDYPPLAEALATVSEHLPPDQAADYAAQATEVFLTRLQDRVVWALACHQVGQAIVAVSPRLDAAAATRAAEGLDALVRRHESLPSAWEYVSRALVTVCQRLPASDSAARVNGMVDFILARLSSTEAKRLHYLYHAKALGALGGRLDAVRAARAAEAILAALGDAEAVGGVKREFVMYGFIAEALAEVAERLDAEGGLRVAEGLVLLLRKTGDIATAMEGLRAALVSACRRLDADGAARVSETIVAAVRDPQTSVRVRTLFAHALVVLGGQLDPAKAASLEGALVDSLVANLADARSLEARGLLGQALASVCGRPGAKSAARAAEALAAAIRDPQTPLALLKPLAEALAAVGGQLTPVEASSHANQAVEVLDSLWVARTGPLDRAPLAEALAAVWTRLGPDEAGAHARRVAADLEDAFGAAKAAPNELYRLAEALAAVYGHLDPAERGPRANAVADALVAALRRPRNDLATVLQLSEALATLCVCLDRPAVVQVADALLTVSGDPDVRRYLVEFPEKTFKRFAARLDERDLQRLLDHPLVAGRLQRVILEALGGSKQPRFRNAWDYLDWTESVGNGTDAPLPGSNR
jgi:hypothetical protein